MLTAGRRRCFAGASTTRRWLSQGQQAGPRTIRYEEMIGGGNPLNLPRLPIPALKDTMARCGGHQFASGVQSVAALASAPLCSKIHVVVGVER